MNNAAVRPNGPPQQQRMPGNFLGDTRQALITLSPMVPSTVDQAGIITTQQLPTSGYLSAIWFILQGTTTTGTAGVTTVKPYPQTPWSFIRRIRVYTNMGVDLWNTSGYGAYLYQRTLRTSWDPQLNQGPLSYAATNGGSNATVFSRYSDPAASIGASATDTWRAGFYLPIAWGTMGQAGLQLLQDDAVKYYLEITWGDNTDLYTTFTDATLSGVTLTPVVETFATPRNPNNRPDLSYSKQIIEEQQPFDTGSGSNIYKFVTGNMVTRLLHYLENGTTLAPVDPAAVTNLRLDYAQTQVPYNINPDVELFREAILRSLQMPQGVYTWELSAALGLPEFPTLRDVINTIKLTNLQTEITVSGLTLAGNHAIHTVKEMLSPNRRF